MKTFMRRALEDGVRRENLRGLALVVAFLIAVYLCIEAVLAQWGIVTRGLLCLLAVVIFAAAMHLLDLAWSHFNQAVLAHHFRIGAGPPSDNVPQPVREATERLNRAMYSAAGLTVAGVVLIFVSIAIEV